MARAAIYLTVRDGRLIPGDAYAQQQLAELPPGDYLFRPSKLTRAGREEREGMRGLWWAGLGLLAENTDDPQLDDKRKAHEAILLALGYMRPRFRVDGSWEPVVVSTKEGEMDDSEFEALMARAAVYVEKRCGWNPWQKWKDEQDARGLKK